MPFVTSLRRRAVAIAAVAGGLLLPAAASASTTQTVFFEAPRDLTAGIATDQTRAAAFADLQSLGVKALRVNLRWADVAPDAMAQAKPAFDATDPAAYSWGKYETTIDEATRRGWKVLISLASPVPRWATAAKADQITRPSAAEFKLFATAAARRFGDAPGVLWSIWNEPNLPRFLAPQISGGKVVGPTLYRELYVAGRAGVREGGSTTPVLFGETAPVGSSTDGRVMPLAFLRGALCLNTKYKRTGKCSRLTIDGYAHHPYEFKPRKLKADDVTYRTISRLTKALDRAAKAKAVNAKVPVYFTEFGFQSLPDTLLGYPQAEFYERRARVERDAYFNSRIRSFSQYLLTDDEDNGGFQSGLRFATGTAKPAFDAFRLPLDAKIVGKKVSIWGLVRPAGKATTVTVQRAGRTGGFKPWKTNLATKSNGAFVLSDSVRKGARYRFQWTDADGKVLTSPPVRAWK